VLDEVHESRTLQIFCSVSKDAVQTDRIWKSHRVTRTCKRESLPNFLWLKCRIHQVPGL
jgi:hypothetical protein